MAVFFFAAFFLRWAYAQFGFSVPLQDTPDYDELALNLMDGEGFVSRLNWHGFEMRSWRPPLYPFFLAAIYGLWGYSHAAVQFVQAAIGAATVVLIWFLAHRVCVVAAWPAALFAAVYGPLVAICSEVMSECVFAFLMALAL